MSSTDFISNLKYYGKFLAMIIIIFLLLKFVMNIKIYEALLLSLIITVSILIVENLIYINDATLDPLNCDQCKVTISNDTNNNKEIIDDNNDSPNPHAEMEQEPVKETFISDSIEKIINNISDTLKNNSSQSHEQTMNTEKEDKEIYQLKCVKTNDTNNKKVESSNTDKTTELIDEVEMLKRTLEDLKKDNEMIKNQQSSNDKKVNTNDEIVESFSNTNELENFIDEQKNQNKNLSNKLKSQPKIQATVNKVKNDVNNQTKKIEESLENPYLSRAGLLNKPKQLEELDSKPKLNPDDEYNLDTPITYDAGYVQYQKDGLQKQENDVSFDNTLFRMGIGQENVVKPFMRDGNAYYNRIQSYSSKAPTPSESLNSELRYGDYNYISPLNSGMTNSDYTFVSPNNWYPVPPHPPVCVTNKQCTTSPIMISDGQDWMNWATLEDFDKSRRFTGNMGINIDYVKNVLNNDEGY